MDLLLHGLMPVEAQRQFTWGFWFVAALGPYLVLGQLAFWTLFLILRPPVRPPLDREVIRLQRRLLGQPRRAEVISVALLFLLIAGFIGARFVRVETVWVATLVFIAAFATGVLDTGRFQRGVNWGLMLYFGVLLGLEGIFKVLHIDAWLTTLMSSALTDHVHGPYLFVLILGVTAFLIHFIVPWSTASPILALISIPLAATLGISPFVPIMVIMLAGDHNFLPYVNVAYLTMYYATEGELFTHEQARPFLWLESLYRIIALMASVPYWKALGLIP
jgi:DASS family divalent anion:Na+ symporter